jgi:predicted DNA-binding transcriptional regulator AlpA
MTASTHPDILTLDQVCSRYGIDDRTGLRRNADGQFPPCFRVGKFRRWRLDTVERWEREQEAGPKRIRTRRVLATEPRQGA